MNQLSTDEISTKKVHKILFFYLLFCPWIPLSLISSISHFWQVHPIIIWDASQLPLAEKQKPKNKTHFYFYFSYKDNEAKMNKCKCDFCIIIFHAFQTLSKPSTTSILLADWSYLQNRPSIASPQKLFSGDLNLQGKFDCTHNLTLEKCERQNLWYLLQNWSW